MGTDELLEAIRRWAATHHPTRVPQRVTLRFSDGERVRLLVGTAPDRQPAKPAPALSEAEMDVLEHLDLLREPMSHRAIQEALFAQGKTHGVNTVYDACKRLELVGYVEAVRGKGYRVKPHP